MFSARNRKFPDLVEQEVRVNNLHIKVGRLDLKGCLEFAMTRPRRIQGTARKFKTIKGGNFAIGTSLGRDLNSQ